MALRQSLRLAPLFRSTFITAVMGTSWVELVKSNQLWTRGDFGVCFVQQVSYRHVTLASALIIFKPINPIRPYIHIWQNRPKSVKEGTYIVTDYSTNHISQIASTWNMKLMISDQFCKQVYMITMSVDAQIIRGPRLSYC